MDRKQLLEEVDELLQTYCRGCLVKSTLRKEYGKTRAHRFCIRECTVGEKLKEYGRRL
ncbi:MULTISPECIES: zinc-finger domain-containing protein [Bacillus]|uniref:zinc-finger domain-containing protein n=1 Tax=Bacillus TaxID=1386 RepID=UPI0002FD0CEC|nr:zinc-finger domain-containing protein [Bacillus smithii]AKP47511.1 hypothetical protein BSM4216_2269 [Bacillus smithii]MED0659718.1 zinc-finger domain-containing protein [Bacillus smithii]MED1420072.1 zinc-finger domain-containing protein [Bacillus smithii]MED1455572.1 zinc-finger domain-containing protein [Bacillus smithii]MED1490297.1 zinc-finger domain-containing protein [Bacillus smithii]